MDSLEFTFPASGSIVRRTRIGVVSSGDLEVLMEPRSDGCTQFIVETSVTGFRETWEAILGRFVSRFDAAATIRIHDAGATPGTVLLRLEQASERCKE